jgi:hypothetical protein
MKTLEISSILCFPTVFGSENIVFGDRTIVTVPQGSIGYCTEFGHPVLLPPGMHQ